MPLKLNVGLARKVGETNYGSRGASVNIEMELESALVGEPSKLKDRIRQLFDVVRTSLTDELNGNGNGHGPANGSSQSSPPAHGDNGYRNRTSSTGQSSTGQKQVRPATQSQVKALYAISKSRGLDLGRLLRDRFRLNRPEDLSIKDASSLIDEMKRKE